MSDGSDSDSSEYKVYVCTKIVAAKPMEKDGQEGYKVVYKDGYKSWSPKAVFDEGYKDVEELGLIPLAFKGFEI